MKTNHLLRWLVTAALAVSLPVMSRAMSGHGTGGFAGGGSHRSSQQGFNHQLGSNRYFRGHPFVAHRNFFHNRRFFFGFDFVAFGFPYWWYPDYYTYPFDYASYDYSPVYDYRYWYGLSAAVQTELARRGYYQGPIDGVIGPGSREAIRSFQQAEGLPVTGLIDPRLLRALKLPAVPRVAETHHRSPLEYG
jgi:hypothetical protein